MRYMDALRRILDVLLPPRDTERRVRDAHDTALHALLSPSAFSLGTHSVVTLLPYRAPLVQACIVEAKYHGNKKAQMMLGNVLAEYLLEESAETALVVIPLPLGKRRERERGYNQVQVVVQHALKACGDTCTYDTTLLVRTRETDPQTKLKKKERLHNMQGAFEVRGQVSDHTSYIVIDDVVTTGATLSASLEALSLKGAKYACALALAH